MIIAKPKAGTLFSLGTFIVVCLIASGYAIRHILSGQVILWYHYALAVILFPLGAGLFFRSLFGYRIVKIGKEKIEVYFPSRFKRLNYRIKDIERWKETKIKTLSGTYKEVEIFFHDKQSLNLAMQEHTDYPQVISYLNKKCAKLRIDA